MTLTKKEDHYHCIYSKEEIKISPDIQFYDVEQVLNPFTGDDYNKISKSKQTWPKKIEKSTLKTNAQNRLVSELSKF
jgi:hypothetical protein